MATTQAAAETGAAILRPLRLRILEALDRPDSASGLARRLGTTRQRVNYHVRELERRKMVELVEERRRGNCVERRVRATARSWAIRLEALGDLGADPDRAGDRVSSAYLVALAAGAIRDIAHLREGAAKAGQRLATFALQTGVRFASAEARRRFADELAREVARLAAKYHDEAAGGGRRYRLFLGTYPEVKKKPGTETESTREDER